VCGNTDENTHVDRREEICIILDRREEIRKAAKAGEATPGSIRPDFLVKRCCHRLNIFLQCHHLIRIQTPTFIS
jgi:hypothetical protein